MIGHLSHSLAHEIRRQGSPYRGLVMMLAEAIGVTALRPGDFFSEENFAQIDRLPDDVQERVAAIVRHAQAGEARLEAQVAELYSLCALSEALSVAQEYNVLLGDRGFMNICVKRHGAQIVGQVAYMAWDGRDRNAAFESASELVAKVRQILDFVKGNGGAP